MAKRKYTRKLVVEPIVVPSEPIAFYSVEPIFEVPHEFGLDDVLAHFGKSREDVKALLLGVGIHFSAQAFAFLHSLDRIPAEMTLEQFDKIYTELMA